MNTPTSRIPVTLASLAAGALAAIPGHAQFNVDLKSTATAGANGLADRLYGVTAQGAVTANRLPIGTAFWFVFDTIGDGVPAWGDPAGSTFNDVTILGADDVKYELTLNIVGRISRSVTSIPDTLRLSNDPLEADYNKTKPLFGLLFNVAPTGLDDLNETAKFAVWSFGSIDIPSGGLGNANARIFQNVFADQYNYTVVPEPGTFALVTGFGLLGFIAVRRRLHRG